MFCFTVGYGVGKVLIAECIAEIMEGIVNSYLWRSGSYDGRGGEEP